MNQDQIGGIARIIVPAVCTWLAAKGMSWFGDEGVAAQITVIVIAVAALVWSYFSHTNAAKLRAAAAIDPALTISVPEHVVTDDLGVARLVHDPQTPNVTIVAPVPGTPSWDATRHGAKP
jgi:hypothetical protein